MCLPVDNANVGHCSASSISIGAWVLNKGLELRNASGDGSDHCCDSCFCWGTRIVLAWPVIALGGVISVVETVVRLSLLAMLPLLGLIYLATCCCECCQGDDNDRYGEDAHCLTPLVEWLVDGPVAGIDNTIRSLTGLVMNPIAGRDRLRYSDLRLFGEIDPYPVL